MMISCQSSDESISTCNFRTFYQVKVEYLDIRKKAFSLINKYKNLYFILVLAIRNYRARAIPMFELFSLSKPLAAVSIL